MSERPVGLLGRLPGQIPTGLRDLTYYVAGPLPKAPSTVECPVGGPWGMLANDVVGDCGVAGLQHGFMTDATITHEKEPNATDAQAKNYYFTYTGGVDSGVVLSQYLSYVRQHGYYGHSVDSFAPVAVHDVPTLRSSIFLFGFAYTGIIVTASMQRAFAARHPWTTAQLEEPPKGGHCVPLIGYDEKLVYCVTWGEIQPITWSAWHYMSSEAWAVVTGEFVARNGDGRGVNLAALRSDLDKLAA
jgi:hypothetical protein